MNVKLIHGQVLNGIVEIPQHLNLLILNIIKNVYFLSWKANNYRRKSFKQSLEYILLENSQKTRGVYPMQGEKRVLGIEKAIALVNRVEQSAYIVEETLIFIDLIENIVMVLLKKL